MDPFLKMDIFFVVSTLAVIALAGFACYALWRFERVLRQLEHISEQVAAESETIRLDLAEMRMQVRKKGALAALARFFLKHRTDDP